MRRLLALAAIAAFPLSCARTANEPSRPDHATSSSVVTSSVSPTSQSTFEGVPATWKGALSFDQATDGAPLEIGWDKETDGTVETDVCGGLFNTPCQDICSNTFLRPETSGFVPYPVAFSLPIDTDGDGDDDVVSFQYDFNAFRYRAVFYRSQNRSLLAPPAEEWVDVGSPAAADVGDIDGDGDLDVIQFGGYTTVLVNDGTGTFGYDFREFYSDTDSLIAAVLADIDGDLDLDSVYVEGAQLTWRFNDGTGLFGSTTSEPLPIVATDMTAGDVDGDGVEDLVIAGTSSIVVLTGDGSGGFDAPVSYAATSPEEVLLGDLDGVNGLDIVARAGGVHIRLNDGTGSFPSGSTTAAAAGLALGDVDGDTILDVLTGGSQLDVFLGTGAGTLVTPPVSTGLLTDAASTLTSGDLDDDGFADVLIDPVIHLYGRADGHVGAARYLSVAGGALGVVRPLDANNDGDADIVVGRPGELALFLGDGTGALTTGPVLPTGGLPVKVLQVASLNGDAVPDFVFASGPVGVILSQGGTWLAPVIVSGGANAQDVTVVDVDGADGPDLVFPDLLNGEVEILFNDGTGNFANGMSIPVGFAASRVEAADLDNDGDVDLAVVDTFGLHILHNNGLLAFPSSVDVFLFSFTIGNMALGDANGDVLPDLVVTSQNSSDLKILPNSSGSFNDVASMPMPFGSTDPQFADVTGDGRTDVVLASSAVGGVSIYELTPFGNPKLVARPAGSGPHANALVDLDDDGGLDIVTTNLTSNELSILDSTPTRWTCPVPAQFTYYDSGDFTATLSATMTLGTFEQATLVSVVELSPEDVQVAPYLGSDIEGEEMQFYGTATVAPGDFITSCEIDYGDGTVDTIPFCSSNGSLLPDGRFSAFIGPFLHTFVDGDPTTYTVALTVFDEDGSGSAFTLWDEENAPPSVGTVVSLGSIAEGSPADFVATFSDPAGDLDGSFLVEWDFEPGAVFATDFSEVVALPGSGSTGTGVFDAEGSRTVAVRVTDQTDGAGVSSPGSLTSTEGTLAVVVVDHAPAIGPISAVGPAVEQQLTTLSASVSGVASDPLATCTWNFGDGTPTETDPACAGLVSGTTSRTHVYADGDPTGYPVTLTVTDEDGVGSTNALVSIGNAPEGATVDLVAPQPSFEGSSVSVTVGIPGSGAGAADAPFLVRFVWGDGAVTQQVTGVVGAVTSAHTYADNGSYSFQAEVFDQVGATGSLGFGSLSSQASTTIVVSNVAPAFAVLADRTTTEGTLLLFGLPATDPAGSSDPLSFSLVSGPAGLAVTSGGTLGWVPTYSQSGGGAGFAHTVTVRVTDGDGGADTQSFDVRSQWLDDDGDGMADTWELGHGMDPTIDDSLGDADGDGIPNINEFNGTGPFTPNSVTPLSPLTGEELNVEDPTLLVQNTTDDDSGALTYVFQLYADASLATLVHEGSAVEGTAGMTAFTLDDTLTDGGTDGDDMANPEDVDLADDAEYWWRVRAFDGTYFGPWSPMQRWRYDPTNDSPGLATTDSPVSLETVSTFSPLLVAGNPAPDDDPPGTITFRVFLDDPNEGGTLIRDSGLLPFGSFGMTSWLVVPPLSTDDRNYFWQIAVEDARGGMSVSGASLFRVNLGNDEPGIPTILAPLDATSVTTTAPTLSVSAAIDADDDFLAYHFDVDTTPSFNSVATQSAVGLSCGLDGVDSCFTPAPLLENGRYWWRVRASDGSAFGDSVNGTFLVDVTNDPPGAPVAVSPVDALVITQTPTFVALVATDPESELLLYDFVIFDEDGELVQGVTGIAAAGESVTWTPPEPLEKGGRFSWQASAVDARGLGGLPSSASFQVYKKPAGGGGGGCSVSAERGSALTGLLLAMAGAIVGMRRRRC